VNKERKPIRWWPALVVLLGAVAGLAFIWFVQERPRQARYIRTAMLLLGTGGLLLFWLLFLSRARWVWRLGVAGGAIACVAAVAAMYEIRGVTGDLVPILEPRWKPRHSVAATPVDHPSETNAWQRVKGEFPGFYGRKRNAVVAGTVLDTNWIAHPPKILWRQPVGQAWSGFAVKDGLAITQEQREEQEYVVCYELLTGRTVWSQANEGRYATTLAGEGPRATPSISSNRVYTFGATGILNCFELETGQRLWSKDTLKENDGSLPDWGMASSPLLVDDKVMVSVGGKDGRSLVAYAAESGEFQWGAGQAGADYSSPVEANLLGTRQVIIFNSFGVVSHDLDGTILWDYGWRGGHPHITPPHVVSSNRVLVSSGYGTGAELLEINRDDQGQWSASTLWKSIALKSKFGPIFVVDDFIYGLDDGILTCLELRTGKRRWKDGRYGHGQGLAVGNVILLTTEKGDIALVEPNPDRLVEVGRFSVLSDKTWNPPALAGEYLLVRNHKEAACLRLKIITELAILRNAGGSAVSKTL
jgi:outer membrane protein assembly factor BamB